MVVLSKELFYKDGAKYTCKTFHTWSESCVRASLMLAPHGVIGCMQFFLPIYTIQAILKYKNFKKSDFISLIKGYLRSTLYGYLFLFTFISSNCAICNLTGRAWYYNVCLFCGFLSGLPIFIETDENRNLDALYFFNLAIEALINNAQYFGYIEKSKLSITLFFMFCSGLLSYLMKRQKEKPYNNIWFHSPKQYKMRTDKYTPNTCIHEKSCDQHLFEGFYKYFIGGYFVEIVKFLLTRFGLLTKKPKMIGHMLFNKNNVLFGLVTGGYVALYRVKAILNYKKFNKGKNFINLLKAYLRSYIFGCTYMVMFQLSSCSLTKILGQLSYYNVCLLNGFNCGLSIYVESAENRYFNAMYFFNMVIEAILRNAQYFGYFKVTKLSLTVFFMICSSLISYLMKQQNEKPYNNLWFHSSQQYKMSAEGECIHKNSCDHHLFEGFYKYFMAGYILEIVKFSLTRYGLLVKNPSMIGKMLFNKSNVRFGLVTGGYVALYRIITCGFAKEHRCEKNYHHLIAGLLAGTTFYIKPNIQFACLGFTTLMQLLLQRAQHRTKLSNKWVGVLYAVSNGILMHNRFILPETCPNFIKNLYNIMSNGLVMDILAVADKIRHGVKL